MNSARRDEIGLAVLYGMVLLGTTALALAHAGKLAQLFYIGSAIVATVLTRKRSPWLFFTATMWFWLGSSFARRMIEWHASFNAQSLVLLTPEIMMLPMFLDIANCPGLFKKNGAQLAFGLTACVLYSLFVSFCKGDVLAGLLSATDWLFPLLYFFHFILNEERIEEAEAHLAIFLPISLLIVAPYSLYQWAHIPGWDGQWLELSGFGVVTYPLESGIRVFGPFNNAGFLAMWCGVGIVLMTYFRSVFGAAAALLTFFTLALAQCRSVYMSTIAAVIAAGILGRGGLGRLAIAGTLGAVGIYAGLALADPDAATQVTSRFFTMGNLKDDVSARARAEILDSFPQLVEHYPLGAGIGSQGRGGAAADTAVSTINIDNGFLAIYLAMGWVVGTVFMFLLGCTMLRLLSIARASKSPLCGTLAGATLCPFCTLPFLYFNGFAGVLLWSCVGYAFALGKKQPLAKISLNLDRNRQLA